MEETARPLSGGHANLENPYNFNEQKHGRNIMKFNQIRSQIKENHEFSIEVQAHLQMQID